MSAIMQPELLFGLADLRDWIIVIYGFLGIVAMLLVILILVFILWQIRNATRAVGNIVDESVRPTLNEARRTAETVRGTTEFISDNAVHPIIRAISTGRGLRKALSGLFSSQERNNRD